MDLLHNYTGSDEEDDEITILPAKSSAPDTIGSNRTVPMIDPTCDQMWAPLQGPSHPFARDAVAEGMRNHKLGFVEDASILPYHFLAEYHTFQNLGYAHDPTGLAYVGDIPHHDQKRRHKNSEERSQLGDVNPSSEEWLVNSRRSPWSGKKEVPQEQLTEEQKKYAEAHAERKRGRKIPPCTDGHVDRTTFHGKEERDYQGRSWITPPKDAKPANERCYIPKRCVHTWAGHTGGVSAIRFFPKQGHLLLSAGMDKEIKIWDVFNSRNCMRTYMGHSEAVRDISFSNDGTKFLSAGYDKYIKYWDTETGKVISTFTTGKDLCVVKLNPDDDKQNILLAGTWDKKVVQWDMNSGQITQVYDQHLGAVNTITFVDDNRRFVTSSDDRSLRVWEFGIPVVIKYISEPHMHSMPSISVHPNSDWLAAQSLDNQILVYSTKDRFQLNKTKRFAGHSVAGYACQVNFSPDGRFVMSGDENGNCWFWDWKSCRVFQTLRCHGTVCIGCEWHPLEQSKVATCGWDGLIHYWD